MEPTNYWVDGRCNQIAMADIVRTVYVIGDDRPYFCAVGWLVMLSRHPEEYTFVPLLICGGFSFDLAMFGGLGSSLFETSFHCFRRTTGHFILKIRHSLLV